MIKIRRRVLVNANTHLDFQQRAPSSNFKYRQIQINKEGSNNIITRLVVKIVNNFFLDTYITHVVNKSYKGAYYFRLNLYNEQYVV